MPSLLCQMFPVPMRALKLGALNGAVEDMTNVLGLVEAVAGLMLTTVASHGVVVVEVAAITSGIPATNCVTSSTVTRAEPEATVPMAKPKSRHKAGVTIGLPLT